MGPPFDRLGCLPLPPLTVRDQVRAQTLTVTRDPGIAFPGHWGIRTAVWPSMVRWVPSHPTDRVAESNIQIRALLTLPTGGAVSGSASPSPNIARVLDHVPSIGSQPSSTKPLNETVPSTLFVMACRRQLSAKRVPVKNLVVQPVVKGWRAVFKRSPRRRPAAQVPTASAPRALSEARPGLISLEFQKRAPVRRAPGLTRRAPPISGGSAAPRLTAVASSTCRAAAR